MQAADPRALIESQLAMLARLAEIGMAVAEEAPNAPDPALAFARVSRAVRMTIALQTRVMKDLADVGREERSARRNRVRRLVEHAIEASCDDDEDEVERLLDEAHEHLSDAEDDLADLPVEAVATRICAALGLPSPPGEKVSPQATDEGADQQADQLHVLAPLDQAAERTDPPPHPTAFHGHLLPEGRRPERRFSGSG